MTNWAAVSDRSPATVIEPVPWASITYERFREWWSSFPLGSRALYFRNRVMGSIGIWPLSDRYGQLLKSAQLKGSQLVDRKITFTTQKPRNRTQFAQRPQ